VEGVEGEERVELAGDPVVDGDRRLERAPPWTDAVADGEGLFARRGRRQALVEEGERARRGPFLPASRARFPQARRLPRVGRVLQGRRSGVQDEEGSDHGARRREAGPARPHLHSPPGRVPWRSVAEALPGPILPVTEGMPISPGDRLGPYEVISLLGAGGMGEVYRARDTKLGREVAIKVLPEELFEDGSAWSASRRKRRPSRRSIHAGIAGLYSFEEISGGTSSSRSFWKERPCASGSSGAAAAAQAVGFGVQIAKGLAAAHEKGIVHGT